MIVELVLEVQVVVADVRSANVLGDGKGVVPAPAVQSDGQDGVRADVPLGADGRLVGPGPAGRRQAEPGVPGQGPDLGHVEGVVARSCIGGKCSKSGGSL